MSILALAFPAAAGGREGTALRPFCGICCQIAMYTILLAAAGMTAGGKQLVQKRRIMNYTKPEVTVLGEAVRVIEGTHTKHNGTIIDGPSVYWLIPTYDLDE